MKIWSQGITYLIILLVLAFSMAALSSASKVVTQVRQREKEAELLWVGNAFRKAIASYYLSSPGAIKRYPSKLEDLLLDRRLLYKSRYLRKIYVDPMTGVADWGLIRSPDGGISGVFSKSNAAPIKQEAFPLEDENFVGAHSYSLWRFEFVPSR